MTAKDKKEEKLEPILGLTVEELNEYVYYFDVKTVQKLFDWTGATPLVNHRNVVVGVIPHSAKIADELIVYEEGSKTFRLRC